MRWSVNMLRLDFKIFFGLPLMPWCNSNGRTKTYKTTYSISLILIWRSNEICIERINRSSLCLKIVMHCIFIFNFSSWYGWVLIGRPVHNNLVATGLMESFYSFFCYTALLNVAVISITRMKSHLGLEVWHFYSSRLFKELVCEWSHSRQIIHGCSYPTWSVVFPSRPSPIK